MSKQFPAISVATRGRVKRKSLCELCRAIRILNCLPYPQAVSNKIIKKRVPITWILFAVCFII